jgi:hypothetical protein
VFSSSGGLDHFSAKLIWALAFTKFFYKELCVLRYYFCIKLFMWKGRGRTIILFIYYCFLKLENMKKEFVVGEIKSVFVL